MLIAIAAILVCLAGASSWFSNYSTRAKINEALSVAEKAKTAIIVTCSENSGISELSNTKVGIGLIPSVIIHKTLEHKTEIVAG